MTVRPQFYSPTPLDETQLFALAPSIFTVSRYPETSEKFQPIPTIHAIRALAKEGFVPYGASQARTRVAGRKSYVKHMIKFRSLSDQTRSKVGDSTFEVIMTNGNDGSKRYNLDSGIFRLACLNGMVVKDRDFGSFHVRHTGMDILQRVLEGTHEVAKNAERVMSAPAMWSHIQLGIDAQLDFAEKAHVIRFGEGEDRISSPQLLTPRRPEDNKPDLWSVFNIIQENVTQGGLREGRRQPGATRDWVTRPVRNIDSNLLINKKLWELAQTYAMAA